MVNLNQFRIFHAAASLSSFTLAASAMHLTQPGISKHVRQLEEHYGTRLFERRGKKVSLTPAGQVLFEATQEIVSRVEEAEEKIKQLQGDQRGKIALGATFTVGLYIVPAILATFRKQHPTIDTSLNIVLARFIEDKVLDHTFDIGFVGHEVTNEKLVAKEFFSNELVAVVSSHHKWAGGRRKIRLEEFVTEPFITTTAGSGTRSDMEDRLRRKGITPIKVLDFGNVEGVKKAVEEGLGVSVLSRVTVQRELSSGFLRLVQLTAGKMTRKFTYLYRKDKYLSQATKAFLKHLSNA